MNNIHIIYFEYLLTILEDERVEVLGEVLDILSESEFKVVVERDGNRVEDVAVLRNKFLNNIDYEFSEDDIAELMSEHVSVLEILMVMSEHMHDVTFNADSELGLYHWFWTLLYHLSLDSFTNPVEDEEIWSIKNFIETFVNREYEFNGTGGLYPLNFPEKDQREVELFYQMQAWFLEKKRGI